MDINSFINRIDERRKALGLSERGASIAATGKPDAIRSIRRGAVPLVTTVNALADVLGVPVEWLITGRGSPNADTKPAPGLDRDLLMQVLIGAHPVMTSIIKKIPAAEFASAILDAYDVAANHDENHGE